MIQLKYNYKMEILPLTTRTVYNHVLVFNQILFGFSRFNKRALFVNRITRIKFRLSSLVFHR